MKIVVVLMFTLHSSHPTIEVHYEGPVKIIGKPVSDGNTSDIFIAGRSNSPKLGRDKK